MDVHLLNNALHTRHSEHCGAGSEIVESAPLTPSYLMPSCIFHKRCTAFC